MSKSEIYKGFAAEIFKQIGAFFIFWNCSIEFVWCNFTFEVDTSLLEYELCEILGKLVVEIFVLGIGLFVDHRLELPLA